MSSPQQWLDEILEATEALLADETLNHQQVTFVKTIINSTQIINNGFYLIPVNATETNHIMSEIGHNFSSPVTSIRGYSDMLLSAPTQFGAIEVSDLQKQSFVQIRDNSNKLWEWKQSIIEHAELYRRKMFKAPPQSINLYQFLKYYVPQFQYILRLLPRVDTYSDVSVELFADIPLNLPFAIANPYHLSHLLQHIILTIPKELVKEGDIHLSTAVEDNSVIINISCDTLDLTKDALFTLFEKQGRHLYREKLEAQGGKISIPSSTNIALHLTKS